MFINHFHSQEEANQIWFTSDQHFGHANIIKFCNRPFANVAQMDEAMIDRWNGVVQPHDTVFHLGDFTLKDTNVAEEYFRQLNGRILVLATEWHHDNRWLGINPNHYPPCVALGDNGPLVSASVHAVQLLSPMVMLEIPWLGKNGFPLAITLCHYPIGEWESKHHGAWHLHGHSHGRYVHKDDGFILDVGVDTHDFCPISMASVTEQMKLRGWV